ncbi:uracil-DNA glycosylase [Patulibacter sp. SYSU D01012]|uniref:uracil-DNA glycosylase n=1 Tax=Patulibacter sp. SYSU D01012 TaxID=2817381 RepID=UPI001B30C083
MSTAPAPVDLAEKVPDAWRPYVDRQALAGVEAFLGAEVAAGRRIQPLRAQVFRALDLVAPQDVRVVLCGQDPYPGLGVPMGLAFSVPPEAPIPGSLRNLFAELQQDVGVPAPASGDLTPWARHGMLLLNATLTVRPGEPASHARCGWQDVTFGLLRRLAEERRGLVFLALGRHAQGVVSRLPLDGHRVVEAAHPSPMSARLFHGSRPFSRTDAALVELGGAPFDWRLA